MEFSKAYDYFEKMGFEFKFDEATPAWAWSNCHVLWKGVEFGVMYQDNMRLSDGNDMLYQYSYRYSFYPDKEIYDLVDKFIKNAREIPAKRVIETKRDRANQVRDYFARKRAAE